MAKIMEITDLSAPELDVYARLSEVQLYHIYEPAEGLFIAESPKVIERALQAGYEPVSFLVEDKHIQEEAKDILARCADIPAYTAKYEVLTGLTGYALTRGLLCAMKRKPLPSMEEVCRNARRIAVLEDVVNPTNIGAIVRSAAALHMDAILFTKASSDPLYRRAIRVSMGTIFQIPWTIIPSVDIKKLEELGFQSVAMALRDDSIGIDDPVFQTIDKLAILLGTEGDGLKNQTITDCHYTVKIPMSHEVDSLNVAAASAVAFWQLSIH